MAGFRTSGDRLRSAQASKIEFELDLKKGKYTHNSRLIQEGERIGDEINSAMRTMKRDLTHKLDLDDRACQIIDGCIFEMMESIRDSETL